MRTEPAPSQWGFPGPGRFDPDDDTQAIAVAQRKRIEAELEEV